MLWSLKSTSNRVNRYGGVLVETLAEISLLEWILIVDTIFLLWAFRPRKALDYGRSTRASLRNGLPGSFSRE